MAAAVRGLVVAERHIRTMMKRVNVATIRPTFDVSVSRSEGEAMKPKVHAITLAVDDLGRSLDFYRDGLGWQSEGIIASEFQRDDTSGAGAIAIFRLDNGLMLALYPRPELAHDAKVPLGPSKPGEFSVGHLVDSRQAVDEAIALAEAAGATITDRPHDRPFGVYSGYFSDPDGHLWEIIWNPEVQAG